jgi:hypothetical protein
MSASLAAALVGVRGGSPMSCAMEKKGTSIKKWAFFDDDINPADNCWAAA